MPTIPNLPPLLRSPRYRWDPVVRRFRAPNGRFVAPTTVRSQLDHVLDGIGAEMKAISGQLRSGEISLGQWQTAMMEKIKESHLTAAVAERGGWSQMTQSDFGRVGQIIRREYGYVRNFADEIASGKVSLDGRIDARANLYGQAGRDTFYRFEHREQMREGRREVASYLNPADHCSECVDLADNWYDLETLELVEGTGPPVYEYIGQRICRSNCRCGERYRDAVTGEEVTV